jgi:hypothetical protein
MPDPVAGPSRELEQSLGAALVASVAPEEAPYFDELTSASAKAAVQTDHELAFGVSVETVGIASMAMLTIAKLLLSFVWANAKDSAGTLIRDTAEDARKLFEKKLQAWIKSGLKEPVAARIPEAKAKEAIASLTAEAKRLGLNAEQTKALSTKLTSILVHKAVN